MQQLCFLLCPLREPNSETLLEVGRIFLPAPLRCSVFVIAKNNTGEFMITQLMLDMLNIGCHIILKLLRYS